MSDTLNKLIQVIFDSHFDSEWDCQQCEMHFARLADLVARGADMRQLMPAVEEHLLCCANCAEEFGALLAIVRAELNHLVEQNEIE